MEPPAGKSRLPWSLARFDITVPRPCKAGYGRDSCVMRRTGAAGCENFMTTSKHETTAAPFGNHPELPDHIRQDHALAGFAGAAEADCGQAQIYARRAAVLQNRGELQQAVADCDAAIGLDPGNATYYRMRGNLRNMQADLDGAIADFDAAITLDPAFAAAY